MNQETCSRSKPLPGTRVTVVTESKSRQQHREKQRAKVGAGRLVRLEMCLFVVIRYTVKRASRLQSRRYLRLVSVAKHSRSTCSKYLIGTGGFVSDIVVLKGI